LAEADRPVSGLSCAGGGPAGVTPSLENRSSTVSRLMRRILAGIALTFAFVAGLDVVPIRMVQAAPSTRTIIIRASAEDPAHASGATGFPLSHLGVRWRGSLDANVETRWQVGDVWSGWQPVDVDHDMSAGSHDV